jgi:hypothetical protein
VAVWGCLDEPPPAKGPLDDALKVQVITFDPQGLGGTKFDRSNYTPVDGINVKLCASIDADCQRPAQEQVTDARGRASFALPPKASVFLRYTRSDLFPINAYIHPSVLGPRLDAESGAFLFPSPMLSKSAFGFLAALAGVKVDDSGESGHLFMRATNCLGGFSSGVSFTVDRTSPNTVPFVVINGLPSPTATVTDEEATAGALNVPKGPVTVTARIGAAGRVIGTFNGIVMPKTVSVVEVAPAPFYVNK